MGLDTPIPVWSKRISSRALSRYAVALDSGDAIGAKLILEFEEGVANTFGRRYGVFCSSGSGALMAAMYYFKDLGIKKVSIPSTTWIANLNSALAVGLDVEFRDTDKMSLLSKWSALDCDLRKGEQDILWQLIHISGRISSPPNLNFNQIIEDFSQAHFSKVGDKIAGQLGLISVASTGITKCLTTVHGGIILTDDYEIYKWINRFIRNGVDNNLVEKWGHLGLNFKPNAANAAIGINELSLIEDTKASLRRVKEDYIEGLSQIPYVKLLDHGPTETPLYIEIQCKEAIKLRNFLDSRGIQSKTAVPPIHSATYFDRDYDSIKLMLESSLVQTEILGLPSGPDLASESILRVIKTITEFYI